MTDEELTDEELVKALRDTYDLVKMWPEKQPDGFTNLLVLRNLVPDTADRIEDLTEQLEAARADAKEAEAYAEGLERDLKTCCMAQTVMEKLAAELEKENTRLSGLMSERGQMLRRYDQMVVDGAKREEAWKAKLAKAVEALRYYAVEAMPWEADDSLIARTALAEIEGEKT